VVESLLRIVRQVAAERNCSAPLVEQHAPMALQVADRAVLLNRRDTAAAGPAAGLAVDWDPRLDAYLG
jgi:branched-chain amino acid transport system ATP-binding protein